MKQALEKLLASASERFDEAEVFFRSHESVSLKIYKGETEEFSIAESGGVSLRVKEGDKTGGAYSESLEEEHLLDLLSAAQESLELSEEKEFFFAGAQEYPQVESELPTPADPAELTKKLLELESRLYSADPRIVNTYGTYFAQVRAKKILMNSHGLSLEDEGGYSRLAAIPIAEDDKGMVTGFGADVKVQASDLDWEAVFEEAVRTSLSQLGAEPVATGQYPLVFTNLAITRLFGSFTGNFIAENVLKGRSLLKGKLGETIAASKITLIDDPNHPSSLQPSSFDDEGVPVFPLTLIESGVLKDYLYNLRNAAKEGRESNGRGARGISSSVGTSPHHLFIEPGEKSLEELLSEMGEGLLITEITGSAGLDPVSGDFSVPVKGFVIEGGEKAQPVNEVLLAGNFYAMLRDVQALGDTLRVGSGAMLCPAMRFGPMQVSGQ